MNKQTHVDDFIDYNFTKHKYARWMLNHFRLPAALKLDFDEFMKDKKLFCTYKGKRYRVTGASRLGDIWLNQNFTKEYGYQLRVMVDDCSDWGDKPVTSEVMI